MRLIAASLCFGFVFAMAASAAPVLQVSIDICTELTNDDTRLRCYDSLFQPIISTAPISAGTRSWHVTSEVSAVDDSTTVFVWIAGNDGISNRYGRDEEITLSIACREDTTSLWIRFGGHFMSDNQGSGRVTFRVDSNPAVVKSLRESNNNKALGLWNGGTSIPFIKSLFGGEQLYVQATPYSENAVSDFFDISGLEQAIKPLREACHW